MTDATKTTAAPWEEGTAPAPVFNPADHGLEGVALETTDTVTMGKASKGTKGAQKSSGAVMVPRDRLRIAPGFNVRAHTPAYEAHCRALGDSMYAEGWYESKPLEAFTDPDGMLVVTDGHSRLAGYDYAVSKLGAQIPLIPVVVIEGRSMTDLTVGLVRQNTGLALSPIEKAVVVSRLRKWGHDAKAIAEKLGMTPGYVTELMELINAPQALVQAIQAGEVSASTASLAIKRKGAQKAAEAITEAVKTKKATAKPGEAVKVTDKDLGQTKGDRVKATAAKKAPKKAPAADTGEVTLADALKALRAVYEDEAFKELGDKAQQAVLVILNP